MDVIIERAEDETKQQPAAMRGAGLADELKKLAELRDCGVLTQEEFNAQKTRLLQSYELREVSGGSKTSRRSEE